MFLSKSEVPAYLFCCIQDQVTEPCITVGGSENLLQIFKVVVSIGLELPQLQTGLKVLK